MRSYYTARRGIGLSEVLACGEDRDQVVREALRLERHPTIIEQGSGVRCPRCGFIEEEAGVT